MVGLENRFVCLPDAMNVEINRKQSEISRDERPAGSNKVCTPPGTIDKYYCHAFPEEMRDGMDTPRIGRRHTLREAGV